MEKIYNLIDQCDFELKLINHASSFNCRSAVKGRKLNKFRAKTAPTPASNPLNKPLNRVAQRQLSLLLLTDLKIAETSPGGHFVKPKD